MESTNRKIKYTQMVIKDSFLQLFKEKPIFKITVSQICALADINRGTFYIHYSDVYNLMEVLQTQLSQKFETVIKEKCFASVREIISAIILLVYENHEIFSVLLGQNGDANFLNKILNLYKLKFVEIWKDNYSKLNEVQTNYAFSFLSYGSIAVLQDWLKNRMKESADEIALIIEKMCNKGLTAFI